MLIYNDKFSVTPITTHIDVKIFQKDLAQIFYLKNKTINNWFAK